MSDGNKNLKARNSFLIYVSEDGQIKLDVRLENETLWLTQPLMAELFNTTQQNISQHIQNIYEEGELEQPATHKKFLSVRQEGSRQVQQEIANYQKSKYFRCRYIQSNHLDYNYPPSG
ncbi:MAG: hypothetical protein Q7J16_10180 [Candidatus Cloacimonadales bacterium]|nr:hypothetical protein [Candidatus Cloacimonadales bacterium]